MIRFAGHVIEVKKLFPKKSTSKFQKVAIMTGGYLSGAKAAEELASRLHTQWADSFRTSAMAKGDQNPTRMKDDGMGGQVDILNTSYADLPEKWQGENKAQALAAVDLVMSAGDDARNQLESLAAQVHEQWLSRNSWAKDGPLGVSYSELPDEEKQKDRDVILQAIDILGEGSEEEPIDQDMPEDEF